MTTLETKRQNNASFNSGYPKTVDYYLSLPYPIEVIRISEEDGGGYNANIPLLGRYAAQGDGETPVEAITDMLLHLSSLLEEWLRVGFAIPEPTEVKPMSGTLSLRLPKTLHAEVAQAASEEGVSINQFILAATAKSIGSKLAR